MSADPTAPPPPTGTPPPPVGRAVGFEILLVLAVAVFTPLTFSVIDYIRGPANLPPPRPLIETEVSLITYSVGPVLLVCYLIARSGEPWAAFGLTRLRWDDLAWGIVTWGAGYLIYLKIEQLLVRTPEGAAGEADMAMFFKMPGVWWEWALVVAAGLANGVAEELVMRAYLLTRLERVFGSTVWAWLVTSGLFGAYHLHYGLTSALGIACIGLVYGFVFCATRRLWPVAAAHAIGDVAPFLLPGG